VNEHWNREGIEMADRLKSRISAMSTEEAFQSLIKCGILAPCGTKLTPRYLPEDESND
jgi:hypothetical protein